MARDSGGSGTPKWSSRSGDGSAKGILFNIGGILRQRGAASLGCDTNRTCGRRGGAAFVGSSLLQFIDFIVLTYRVSVQDCTFLKVISTSLTISQTVPSR